MTRLSDRENRRFNFTIIVLTVFLIAVVLLLSTIGLKFLFNSAVYLSNFFGSKQSAQTEETPSNFIGSVDIVDIPSATNSAVFTVTGTLLNIDSLEFYLNGNKVKTENENGKDTFTYTVSGLMKGDNQFYLLGKNDTQKKSKQTGIFTVHYSDSKPKLDIKEPADNATVSSQEIRVSGVTDPSITVKINSYPVVVDTKGNFNSSVKLQEGTNKITVTARDEAGNTEEKTLTVTYQKPD